MKWKKMLKGAGIGAMCAAVAKLLGALYRIPLTNIAGAEGIGLYQMVFPLYTVLLTISSGGLTSAISKEVASSLAKNDGRGALKILRVSLVSLLVLSGVSAAFVIVFRGRIAALQGNSEASIAYLGIAPAIVLVAVISSFRGYFQGHGNMLPSGVSQIAEQLFKLVFGLYFAARLLPRGVQYAVFGAVLGITLSELAAALFLLLQFWFSYSRKKRKMVIPLSKLSHLGKLSNLREETYLDEVSYLSKEPSASLLPNLNFEAGADVMLDSSKKPTVDVLQNAIGNTLVLSKTKAHIIAKESTKNKNNLPKKIKCATVNRIKKRKADERIPNKGKTKSTKKTFGLHLNKIVVQTAPNTPPKTSEILKRLYKIAIPVTLGSLIMPLTQVIDSVMVINVLVSGGMTRVAATSLFGLVGGPINSLVNMPVAVTLSISVALLPKIAFVREKGGDAGEAISGAIRLMLLLALPAATVFMVFPRQIVTALYSRGLSEGQLSIASSLLRIESLSVLYIGIIQVCTSVLQGADKPHRPALNLLYGAVVKVLVTLVLLPFLGIRGAAAASVFCYGVIATLGVFYARKVSAPRLSIKNTLIMPIIACAAMVLAAFGAMYLLSVLPLSLSPTLKKLSAIAFGGVVYAIILFISKTVTAKEIFK